jgi:AcrR family transcriptional regulator
MPRTLHPSKEAVITAFRRSALLEAAQKVFGTCGFDGATMERIAQEAGVAKGTIYLYYSSKQSIYDASLNSALAELDNVTRRRLDAAATVREAVSAFIQARTEYFLSHPDFFCMYIAAVTAHITTRKKRASALRSILDRQTRGLEAVIARGVARGEVRRVDPAATALAIFDVTRGFVARTLFLAPGASAAARSSGDTEFLAGLIWHGLGRPDATKTKTPMKRKR